MNQSAEAKRLLESFLAEAKKVAGDIEPIRVLRCHAFRIKNANVLVRVAADTGKYFFGLNYINAEEVANLENSFIAFVCGSVDNTLIIPMQLFIKRLPEMMPLVAKRGPPPPLPRKPRCRPNNRLGPAVG